MRPRTTVFSILVLAIVLLAVSPASAADRIGIVVGQSRILPVYDLQRVAVADPAVADVVVISGREVVINGLNSGTTTLHIWEKAGRKEYEISVYVDSSAVERQIEALVGDAGLSVKVINDSVILDGYVPAEVRERAVKVAQAFGRVVDLLREPLQPASVPDIRTLVEQGIGDPGIAVHMYNDTVFLEGVVKTELEKRRAEEIASSYTDKFVNLLVVVPEKKQEEPRSEESGAVLPVQETDETAVPVSLDTQIADAIGDARINVRVINDTAILEGTVFDQFSVKRAEGIAQAFDVKVLNLIKVVPEKIDKPSISLSGPVELAVAPDKLGVPVTPGQADGQNASTEPEDAADEESEEVDIASVIAAIINHSGITAKRVGDIVFVEGTVHDDWEQTRAERIAKALSPQSVVLVRVVPEPQEEAVQAVSGPHPVSEGTALSNPQKVPQKGKEAGEPDLVQIMRQAINRSTVYVTELGEVIFIEGTVSDEWERTRVERIAEAISPTSVTLVRIAAISPEEPDTDAGAGDIKETSDEEKDASGWSSGQGEEDSRISDEDSERRDLAGTIAGVINRPQVAVTLVDETIFVEGEVVDEWEQVRIERIARALSPNSVVLVRVVPPAPKTVSGETPSTGQEAIEKHSQAHEASDTQEASNTKEATASASLQSGQAFPTDPTGSEKDEPEAPAKETPDEMRKRLAKEAASEIADSRVTVRVVGAKLFLEGMLGSDLEVARAEAIAQALYPEVVSLLQVAESPQTSIADEISSVLGRKTVKVTEAGSRIVLSGEVADQAELNEVLDIAGSFGIETINHLIVRDPLQVMLQVQALEIMKNEVDNLGFTWGRNDRGVFKANEWFFSQLDLASPLERASLIAAKLDILINSGTAKVLASPSLVTLDGEPAEFLAGGEIPVIYLAEDQKEVQWKQYGIKLEMTPRIQKNGDISVEIAPEVSTLDWANGVRVESYVIPAMKTRRAKSTLQVPDGGTIMLAGLLQSDEAKQVEKIPLLGELPIIGRLFRSERFQRQETELVFLVTPKITRSSEVLDTHEADLQGRYENE